jgi:hypothetical protein
MPEKYKQEIEDILRQAGEWTTPERVRKRRQSVWKLSWHQAKGSLKGKAWAITPGRVMLTALLVFLTALIIYPAAPNLGLVGPMAIAGLVLFAVAYGLFFVRRPGYEKRWRGRSVGEGRLSHSEKRWRGMPIEDNEPSWWNRFRSRLRR